MFRRSDHLQPRQGPITTTHERGSAPPGTGVAPDGGSLAAAWGVLGILLLLLRAVTGLGGRGLDTIRAGLEPVEVTALVVLTLFFLLTEGVGALQRRWVPRVVRRLEGLRRRGGVLYRLLAPLYGMSLIGASRGAMVRSWLGVAAIVAAVLVVRAFPEPWRGIVDFAVAAALAWGSGALLLQSWHAFRPGSDGLPGRPVS